jgi:hypothetical protein
MKGEKGQRDKTRQDRTGQDMIRKKRGEERREGFYQATGTTPLLQRPVLLRSSSVASKANGGNLRPTN